MAQLKDLLVTGASRLIGDAYTNTIQITSLKAPTSAGGSTYGTGTNGQVLLSNGSSIYWGAAAATVTESTVSGWGFTKNTGTITGATANKGLAVSGTTLGHSNSVTAQTTQAIYPIKIDAQGHISAYGAAVTPLTANSTLDATKLSGTIPTSCYTNTWTPMTGATASANGSVGYVNAAPPKDGYNTKYLRADGTWQVPPNTGDTHHTAYLRAGASGGTANAATTTGNTYLNLVENNANRSGVKLVPGNNMSITSDDNGNVTFTATSSTYSAGTGLSLSGTTFNHSNSITAGTIADGGATRTLAFGGTFKIPSITYDAQGHVTSTDTITLTMPANPNTNNAVTQTATSTNADYEVLFSVTADNTTRTEGARKNSNLKFNPSTGNLTVTQINGVTVGSTPKFTDTVTTVTTSGSGNAITAISASNGAITATKGTTFLTSHQDISGKVDKSGDTMTGDLTINTLTASQAIVTDANKKLISADLTVSDPSASGTGIDYITSISQSATGKITATKSTVRSASTSQTGVTQYTAANLNTWINQLTTGSAAPVDADYYISQYAGGGTTTTTYHRRPMSALYSYIKGKTDSIYVSKSGDTMTGNLIRQGSGTIRYVFNQTGVTKGTAPASNRFSQIIFNANGTNGDLNAGYKLAGIENSVTTANLNKLAFSVLPPTSGSSTQKSLSLQCDNSGKYSAECQMNLTVSTSSAEIIAQDTGNNNLKVSLSTGAGHQNHGLYSYGYAPTSSTYTSSGKWIIYRASDGEAHSGMKVYGAVWNDYAEMRESNVVEPGRCVTEVGDGTMILSTQRLQRGCKVTSDTYGFCIGQTKDCNTPIAVSGRVLVHLNESQEEALSHIGYPVCSGPNGTVSIMTDEEEEKYSSRIIGTISEVPTYEYWNGGTEEDPKPIKVNGRIWIYVK